MLKACGEGKNSNSIKNPILSWKRMNYTILIKFERKNNAKSQFLNCKNQFVTFGAWYTMQYAAVMYHLIFNDTTDHTIACLHFKEILNSRMIYKRKILYILN